ncbi:glycosyltransferase family 9 protein [Dyadobacter psychrophilus]|uniref:Lipopolysaccharide heptosyltransferase II n=1 Tax=Dyadobacter psychrophilus TaxID=651661 RepID=A0A1T5EA13_9BACT|nr:glycosyltransferase family 9 protein [Dyadobacter psychrophilus]SKB80837.1 lipopolysaccharide heptosyltransferase II [Dyadobacter psychrophilus]
MYRHNKYKNVLCIRADNMGDVIMASPAFRALKETFDSKITLLTSKAGSIIAPHIPGVDDVMVADLPWVQSTNAENPTLESLAAELKQRAFDAVVIFTVYSQSALPAAMLAYMAGIPVRLAYARENPYQLLTHWLPDLEPYEMIRHQVERDLELVKHIGAETEESQLILDTRDADRAALTKSVANIKIDIQKPFIVLHPGVSEEKRQYPAEHWIETGKALLEKYGLPILISGSGAEKQLTDRIATKIGESAVSVAGLFSIGEFICLLEKASLLISVNTGTIHIAAAMQTPMIVLYAQTNPQHTPWHCQHRILEFSVPEHLRSRNMVIRHVTETLYADYIAYPTPQQILAETDVISSARLLKRTTPAFL